MPTPATETIWVVAVTQRGTIGVATSEAAAEAIAEQYVVQERYQWAYDFWTDWATAEPGTTQRSRLVEVDSSDLEYREEIFINTGPVNQISSEWMVPFDAADY